MNVESRSSIFVPFIDIVLEFKQESCIVFLLFDVSKLISYSFSYLLFMNKVLERISLVNCAVN